MFHNLFTRIVVVFWLVIAAAEVAPLRVAHAQDNHLADVLAQVNQVRVERGLQPVQLSESLNAAAQRQLNDMLAHDFLGHIGTDGTKPSQRVAAAAYRWRAVGENCLYRWDYNAAAAVAQWVNSPAHMANLVYAGFRDAGIAYGQTAAGKIYYVLVLAAPL